MGSTPEILLEISDLTKSYGPVKVLSGINLTMPKGEILGLAGENGAGKSTLAKCIAGRTPVSSGGVRFLVPHATVYTVPQEFNLIPELAVYENIFLGRELSRFGFLVKKDMIETSRCLLKRLRSAVDPLTPVSELSVAEKQMVEIAKAFLRDCSLLIMDEPTTVLNSRETALLFENMEKFRAGGGSVLYISHKLEEVRNICDRIAVLRDGRLVSCTAAKQLSAAEIAERMVGRELTRIFPEKAVVPPDAPDALKVEHLSSGKEVRDVSFTLKKGEILGIAGLAGAGRTELAEALCGLRRTSPETVICVFGEKLRFRKPADALKAGLSYLSEDRQGTAVQTAFSVAENVTLSSLKQYCRFSLVNRSAVRSAAEKYIARFRIRAESPDTPLTSLSGGNQQKVAIAKGLDTGPRIFIFDEPTRGVDVGARGEIYEFIHELSTEGISCLLISSDLEEVIGNCGRVLVMRGGELAGELSGEHVNEKEIMYLATGVEEE